MPFLIDKVDVSLDVHIYPIIDLDLLLGFPLVHHLGTSQGGLDAKLREFAPITTDSCLENPMVKPHPKQNLLETVMHVSPFTSSELAFFEGVEPSTPKEDHSESFYENERPSSPSSKFEPRPAGPFVVFDHD
jgi:hypothetical protein